MSKDNATLGQGAHILTLIGQKDKDKDFLTALIGSGLLADLLDLDDPASINREEFRKVLGLGPLELRISVNYGRSLDEMKKAGNYDWMNDDITAERFPIKGEGIKELVPELIHFNRSISSDNALAELDKMGLRPATIEELLAFGETFPEMQCKFPIIALGSVCRVVGNRRVPYLDEDASERNLDLLWFGGDWNADCRFLAVRKEVSGN